MAISTDFLRQLEKFNLVIRKKVASSFVGERRADVTGSGLIFRDYSNYSYGDDFKNIDWRAYAKSEKLYVKRYEEDRNLTIHILLDLSGSMDFGNKIKKSDFAAMIALGFSYIAMKNNEKFVLSTFDDKLEFFRPQKGAHQLASILRYLNSKQAKGISSFEKSLVSYRSLINSKAMVIIISDFFYDTNEIKNILHRYKGNKIKLIQVLDSMEKKMDIEGDYNLIDLETDGRMHTFVDSFLKKQYFNKLEMHNASIIDACGSVKADFFSVSSDEGIFDVFYKVLS
ncbi:DUF58 domain-containing protein [Candidatus Woesearchaeota archaeon]|nr:DUF58 domain-containing protein [Candidatus Woesearchaeota archaeon]